jgi:hypothetical protein
MGQVDHGNKVGIVKYSKDRIAREGNWEGTAEEGQVGQESHDWKAQTGQPGQYI